MGLCQSAEEDAGPAWNHSRCLTFEDRLGEESGFVEVFSRGSQTKWLFTDLNDGQRFGSCPSNLKLFAKLLAWRLTENSFSPVTEPQPVMVQSVMHRTGTSTPVSERHLYDLLAMQLSLARLTEPTT